MSTSPYDHNARLRWGIYSLLMAVALGNMAGRLLAVNSVDKIRIEEDRIGQRIEREKAAHTESGLAGDQLAAELAKTEAKVRDELRLQRPFLSANDRSRWMTVRALVEHGTYEIDRIVGQPTWDTIDMVQHRGRDGELHLYSSKPPLLATLVAGPYWLVHRATGWTLGDHPYEIGRAILVGVNLLPMLIMFAALAAVIDRLGSTDLGRVFVMAVATLGTQLNTFAIVLNNHIPAAVSAAVAIYAVVRIIHDGDRRVRHFALAGLAAAFSAACELPALAFLAGIALMLFLRSPKLTLLAFAPAAAVVAAAFFATNWIAHESLRPPYMHRSATDPADNWYQYKYTVNGEEKQSYWQNRQGIDIGEPTRELYALHVLVGHHGIFSLTPVWILSAFGALLCLLRGDWQRREWALFILGLTAVCLVFYIGMRPQEDRNYGGMTSGFRWMFWFAPLWLVVMIPAADRLARSAFGIACASILLLFSVLSASYPTWNPWTQPWIYNFLEWSNTIR
jgi:hypothetical protein